MKKLVFVLAVLSVVHAQAQVTKTNNKSETRVVNKLYKPVHGTVTGEFGLSGGLLNTNVNLNNNAGLLRFRYFLNENVGLRIGFAVNSLSETDNFYGGTNNAQVGTKNRASSGITFNLGIEKHFAGSDRLSTYAGVDLLISLNGASESWENFNGVGYAAGYKREISNAVSAATGGGLQVANTGFGARVVAGADYYFVKNVYIGAEFGLGFVSTSTKDYTSTTMVTVGTNTTTTTVEVKSPSKAFEISPNIITGVRVGFQF
jgi:hypothetical protein